GHRDLHDAATGVGAPDGSVAPIDAVTWGVLGEANRGCEDRKGAGKSHSPNGIRSRKPHPEVLVRPGDHWDGFTADGKLLNPNGRWSVQSRGDREDHAGSDPPGERGFSRKVRSSIRRLAHRRFEDRTPRALRGPDVVERALRLEPLRGGGVE